MTVAEVRLVGHLTDADLASELARVERAMVGARAGRCALLVDATKMTGYDPDARTRFVEFNRRARERLCRVAIVTNNGLWRMVISAMAVASGQQMKAFDSAIDARSWLAEEVTGRAFIR